MSSFKLVIMSKKAFWQIRERILKALFTIKKLIYSIHTLYQSNKEGMSIQITLIIQTLKRLIIAALILFALFQVDSFVFDKLIKANPLMTQHDQILTDILIATLSISGIFLGLYFANMSTVYSSRYANAPVSVRHLFENEIVTSSSINDIIQFIIISIIVLMLSLFGVVVRPITIGFIFFLSIKNIVSFAIIGKRSFQFSDVYEITTPLYKNIRKSYLSSTYAGLLFKDANFQAHYQLSARKSIDKLSEITTYSMESGAAKSTSMLVFMCKNLEAIRAYWESKQSIPYDSKWFPMKEVYRKWYEANDTEVSIALLAGTTIRNKSEIDKYWFEERLFAINDTCFEHLLKMRNWTILYEYVLYTKQLVYSSIKSGCSSYFINKTRITMQKIQALITSSREKSDPQYLQLVDAILICYIEFYVASRKYIEEIKPSEIFRSFSQKDKGIQKHAILNDLEIRRLSECISAEKKIERKKITPDWIIQQSIARKVLESIYILINNLINISGTHLKAAIEECIKNEDYTEALLLLSRMAEVKSKFQVCIEKSSRIITALEAYRIDSTLTWPTDTLNARIKDFCLIDKILPQYWVTASVAFTLENKSNLEQYPDLLGHCYNVISDFLVASLAANDFESFKSAYSKYWSIMLLYQDITRTDLLRKKDMLETSLLVKLFAFPMVEFCMISGFALLWGDLLQAPRWIDLVISVRDQIVTQIDDKSNILDDVIKIVSASNGVMPYIYPRETLQTGWVIAITNALREDANIQYEENEENMFFCEKRVKAIDPIVKAYFSGDFDLVGLNPIYELYLVKCINPCTSPEMKYHSRSHWEEDKL